MDAKIYSIESRIKMEEKNRIEAINKIGSLIETINIRDERRAKTPKPSKSVKMSIGSKMFEFGEPSKTKVKTKPLALCVGSPKIAYKITKAYR